MSVDEIKKRLYPIFHNNEIERAVLFGSYAKGQASEKSDIDILIDSKGRLRGIDFFGVLDEISTALGLPVDLIEMSQVVNGGHIEKEIAETGVVLYG